MTTLGIAIETNSVKGLCCLDLLRSTALLVLPALWLLRFTRWNLTLATLSLLRLFLHGPGPIFLLAFLEESLLVPARMAELEKVSKTYIVLKSQTYYTDEKKSLTTVDIRPTW